MDDIVILLMILSVPLAAWMVLREDKQKKELEEKKFWEELDK